ncbi:MULTISPECIES: flavin reductase family protein [Arthrobacter]|uniref:Flavin reductase n=1 Tax=Arthrobacter terricola TaxID=2547396 RepID=A0A4V2ZSK3_9MICC|nr:MULTISPECIES: flavin reductase family protein [Arthrobacter]MBT8162395.1 flavin reductase family protein [Arthrobacter sp. GN70]TDF93354.1 flavin reductase [Arthrobacter terricola]
MQTTTLESPIKGHELRQAMRHWASGIAVITAGPEPLTRIGLVSNSFTSVSLEPPLVSWCVDRNSSSFEAWCRTPSFSIHILDEEDVHLVPRFAAKGTDKFAGLTTHATAVGTPALEAGCVRLDCRAWKTYDGGDHVIIIGEVVCIEPR